MSAGGWKIKKLIAFLCLFATACPLLASAAPRSDNMQSIVVDMHYQSLCATGWTSQDADFIQQGLQSSRRVLTTAPAAAGAYDLVVDSMAGISAGMMVAYQGADGDFYPSKVYKVLSSNSIRLDRPLVTAVAAGAIVGNFYRDDAHPNDYGGQAVVDDALRQMKGSRYSSFEYRSKGPASWTAVGGATLSANQSVSYVNPGDASSEGAGVTVDGIDVGGGAKSAGVYLDAGDHEALVYVNVGLRTGGYSGHIQVFVDELKSDGSKSTIGSSQVTGYEGSFLVRVKFTNTQGSSISIRATTGNAGGYRFYLGMIELRRLGDPVPDLNSGVHVLLADSWGVDTRPIPTRLKSKLDQATIFPAGVAGNVASQMLDRFDADVTPHAPNYVWVLVGTNDYYRGVTSAQFSQQIDTLKSKIKAIGATPIFFTPSVGAITFQPQQLHNSRSFAEGVIYSDIAPIEDLSNYVESHSSFQISVAAGTTATAWVFPAMFSGQAILKFLLTNSPYVSVRFEYVTTSDGAGGKDASIIPGATLVTDYRLQRTNNQNRLLAIRITNPQSFSVYVGGTAAVAWPK